MRCLLTGLLLLLAVSCPAASAPEWSGSWDTRWRDGGARLELHQEGDKVTGAYALLNGTVEATAQGDALSGRWHQGPRSGGFEFVLAPDGRSFVGRFDTGEWWTGSRSAAGSATSEPADLSTPRAAMRTFLKGGNSARYDAPDEMLKATAAVDFGDPSLSPEVRLARTKTLFDLVDATTFRLFSIPDTVTGDHVTVTLRQAGSDAQLPVQFVKTDAGWKLVMPDEAALATDATALYARYGGRAPGPDDYKLRRTASDTYRTFTHAFTDWNAGGRAQALSALDLSGLPLAIRDYQGELAAQYLAGVLNRVGLLEPQEIPDDPNGTQPHVLFSHPAGQVVIAPENADKPTRWAFTRDTVRNARDLFVVVEGLPVIAGRTLPPPPSPFFELRRWIRGVAPSLLGTVGPLEIWQAIGWALVLAVSLLVGLLVAELLIRVALRLFGTDDARADRRSFRYALWGAVAFSVYKLLIPAIGLADEAKQFSVGATGILLIVSVMWLGWITVDRLGMRFFGTREGKRVTMDNIVVSLLFGFIKLALVVIGLTLIAVELSLPYEGIIASLSIGGLAVAFASRETLSNVFGAGVLAIDRPFRRGDSISASGVDGTVEHVGIRSTRVRTSDDSLIVVPNGKLSDTSVSNLASRRFQTGSFKLPLRYSTGVEQIGALMQGMREIADAVPQLIANKTVLTLTTNGTDGIQLAVSYNVDTSKGGTAITITNQLLLDALALCERLSIQPPAKAQLAAE